VTELSAILVAAITFLALTVTGLKTAIYSSRGSPEYRGNAKIDFEILESSKYLSII
jgi:hypothetical protein